MLQTIVIMVFLHTSSDELGLLHIGHETTNEGTRPTYSNMYDCQLAMQKNLTDGLDWQYKANERFVSYVAPERDGFFGYACFELKIP